MISFANVTKNISLSLKAVPWDLLFASFHFEKKSALLVFLKEKLRFAKLSVQFDKLMFTREHKVDTGSINYFVVLLLEFSVFIKTMNINKIVLL